MSNLSIFNFNQNEIRTIIKEDSEIWFVASDVANALDYRDASNMIRNLDSDEAATHNLSIRSENGIEQIREVAIINESGLYSATLKSRKPEAKTFKKWITSEVLPSIRKNGGYIAGQENDDPEIIIAKALQVANNVIERKSKELELANAKVEHLQPKANALDVLSQNKHGYLCLTDVAKHLHIKRCDLTNFMANLKLIYRRATSSITRKGKWAAYDLSIKNGWLFHDYVAGEKPDGTDYAPQVLVTPKGIAYIAELISKELKTAS